MVRGGRGTWTGRGSMIAPSTPVVRPRERGDLVPQQAIDDLGVFGQPLDALPRLPVGYADHRVRRVADEPGPEPDLEPALRDVIEGHRAAGEDGRVPERDLGHARRETDGARRPGQSGQRRPALEPRARRVGPVHEMVRQRRDLEPEPLEAGDPLDEHVPRHVGQAQDLETHAARHAGILAWDTAPRSVGRRRTYLW